jgi:membrane-associated PAP2 superfamily phosphatase
MPTRRRNSDLIVTGVALLALVAWEASGLDLSVMRAFGGPGGFAWRDAWLTSEVLHSGGRALAWLVFGWMVVDAVRADVDVDGDRLFWLGITIACLALIPALKRFSTTSCPWSLAEFGGAVAYVPHWQLGAHDGGPGHCFPSGHAVAAFAFFTLYFGWRESRPRLAAAALVFVCALGAAFGWAQLARGAHYVSHTLWSAWLCWTTCVLAAWARRALARPDYLKVQRP